jgi:hypothetical protein
MALLRLFLPFGPFPFLALLFRVIAETTKRSSFTATCLICQGARLRQPPSFLKQLIRGKYAKLINIGARRNALGRRTEVLGGTKWERCCHGL